MTYSILAKCPDTGRYGMAIATYSVAVGQWCDGLDQYAGISMSQAFVRQTNNRLALNLLRLGHGARHVNDMLVRDDAFSDYRQIGTISANGEASCHTGSGPRAWAGHRVGDAYVAMGNVLVGEHVVDAIASGFEKNKGESFEQRLLLALEAGRDAGGQGTSGHWLAERSSALLVTRSDQVEAVSVRVDLHDKAVDELRRVFSFCHRYADYYRSRGVYPPDAPGQEVFERENGLI